LSQFSNSNDEIQSPELTWLGWLRWIWRQLTSMSTALILLLLLAVAAIPGSIYPQRSADPNGVATYFRDNPTFAGILDTFQFFDVYSSVWFSAIYILLFISLIGCLIPRSIEHYRAMRAEPVKVPTKFDRFPAHAKRKTEKSQKAIYDAATQSLRDRGYRVAVRKDGVSAERGYLRETGNLVFHFALIGVLAAVGIGGAYAFNGQRVLVEGETFVHNLSGYDSFSPGVLFNESQLKPFALTLTKFEALFDLKNQTNIGNPLDFRAQVSLRTSNTEAAKPGLIRVNEPLEVPGAHVYLTGNGYAPVMTFRDPDGRVSYSGPVEFLPQDSNYTSLGVVKLPDAKKQFGVIAFFYPTASKLSTGAMTSKFPGPVDPLLTMNVYEGNLGLDNGAPQNVFTLNVHGMKQVAGGKSGTKALSLQIGETKTLPGGLGTVTWDGVKRFASLDIAYNPTEVFTLVFALLAMTALGVSLSVSRRRVWVKKTEGGYEIAALARTHDPRLEALVEEICSELEQKKSGKADA
jgi:cytochrome c biogenesis protein